MTRYSACKLPRESRYPQSSNQESCKIADVTLFSHYSESFRWTHHHATIHCTKQAIWLAMPGKHVVPETFTYKMDELSFVSIIKCLFIHCIRYSARSDKSGQWESDRTSRVYRGRRT